MVNRRVSEPDLGKAALAEEIRSDKAEHALTIPVTVKILISLLFSEMIFFLNLPEVEHQATKDLAEMRAARAKVRILPIPCG